MNTNKKITIVFFLLLLFYSKIKIRKENCFKLMKLKIIINDVLYTNLLFSINKIIYATDMHMHNRFSTVTLYTQTHV